MKRVLLLVLVLSITTTGSAQIDVTTPTDLEIEVHRLINDVRADKAMHGLDLIPLQLHSVLINVARQHSQDMLERDYFDHINPDGEGASDRVSDAGVEWSMVGENLYKSTGISRDNVAESSVEGWVDSPGHYANIITEFSYTGIGVATSGETYYITQVFVNADPTHLEEIGRIYENDNLDNITPSETDDNFNITISRDMAILMVVGFFVILGIDAGRRNNRYFGRR